MFHTQPPLSNAILALEKNVPKSLSPAVSSQLLIRRQVVVTHTLISRLSNPCMDRWKLWLCSWPIIQPRWKQEESIWLPNERHCSHLIRDLIAIKRKKKKKKWHLALAGTVLQVKLINGYLPTDADVGENHKRDAFASRPTERDSAVLTRKTVWWAFPWEAPAFTGGGNQIPANKGHYIKDYVVFRRCALIVGQRLDSIIQPSWK